MSLYLRELLSPDSKLFAKSEFGPAYAGWPALSFSSMKIAKDFQIASKRGRDFVVYVGTSNAVDTPVPRHRQCLLSVIDSEPRAIIQTKQIVSPEAWARAQERYPGRWDVSLRIARAWNVEDFPRAYDIIPATYAKFQNPGTRGHPIPVETADYPRLSLLKLVPVELALTERATKVLALNVDDSDLRKELSRLVALIRHDIDRALKARDGAFPMRAAPNISELFIMLSRKWGEQKGRCALCDHPIPLKSGNKLLKMSRDRIESTNKEYSPSNVHLTHFGCNLAKSDATLDEWFEYRAMLRSASDLGQATTAQMSCAGSMIK